MVFIFIAVFILSILLLKIKIEIKNLNFKLDRNFFNDDFTISFTIFLLNFIPVFKTKITKEKFKKIDIKGRLGHRIKKYNTDKENSIQLLKIIFPRIKKIDLKIKFGTENAAYTAIIYPIIKTIFNNIFKRDILVEAMFNNKNELNIFLEGIFEVKLIHIINKLIIYNKRRGYKNERTSNRRSYAFSNE